MKVPSRAGYLEELNDFWMEKAHFTIGQERFQVVWEYVAEMARLWDCRQRRGKPPKDQRHPDCFQKLVIDRNETNVYLQRRRSPTRTNRYYDANTYLRQGKPGEYEVWEFGKGLQNTGKGTKKAKNLNNVLFRGCRPDN